MFLAGSEYPHFLRIVGRIHAVVSFPWCTLAWSQGLLLVILSESLSSEGPIALQDELRVNSVRARSQLHLPGLAPLTNLRPVSLLVSPFLF